MPWLSLAKLPVHRNGHSSSSLKVAEVCYEWLGRAGSSRYLPFATKQCVRILTEFQIWRPLIAAGVLSANPLIWVCVGIGCSDGGEMEKGG